MHREQVGERIWAINRPAHGRVQGAVPIRLHLLAEIVEVFLLEYALERGTSRKSTNERLVTGDNGKPARTSRGM